MATAATPTDIPATTTASATSRSAKLIVVRGHAASTLKSFDAPPR
jgi:hypothetical protein